MASAWLFLRLRFFSHLLASLAPLIAGLSNLRALRLLLTCLLLLLGLTTRLFNQLVVVFCIRLNAVLGSEGFYRVFKLVVYLIF
jgi:hypothetical protein